MARDVFWFLLLVHVNVFLGCLSCVMVQFLTTKYTKSVVGTALLAPGATPGTRVLYACVVTACGWCTWCRTGCGVHSMYHGATCISVLTFLHKQLQLRHKSRAVPAWPS